MITLGLKWTILFEYKDWLCWTGTTPFLGEGVWKSTDIHLASGARPRPYYTFFGAWSAPLG